MRTRRLLMALLGCVFLAGPPEKPLQTSETLYAQPGNPACFCRGRIDVYDASDQFLHNFSNEFYPGPMPRFSCAVNCSNWVYDWVQEACDVYPNVAWADSSDSFYLWDGDTYQWGASSHVNCV